MPSSSTFKLQLCACAATFLAGSIAAQEPAADVIASWIALDAPTGHEHLAIESIQRNFNGWEKGRYGNLARLSNRVIFAWSVREEGGLRGAAELASKFYSQTRRVYSIDTFVSSDTPLESPHFAYAPLGNGPVLRSIENSSMATPYELDRNRRLAEEAGIDAQYGLTQGGTDGTTFTVYGAPNAGLSWPGRYSHSPAEIADLRDIAKLIDLIQAMAQAPIDN